MPNGISNPVVLLELIVTVYTGDLLLKQEMSNIGRIKNRLRTTKRNFLNSEEFLYLNENYLKNRNVSNNELNTTKQQPKDTIIYLDQDNAEQNTNEFRNLLSNEINERYYVRVSFCGSSVGFF